MDSEERKLQELFDASAGEAMPLQVERMLQGAQQVTQPGAGRHARQSGWLLWLVRVLVPAGAVAVLVAAALYLWDGKQGDGGPLLAMGAHQSDVRAAAVDGAAEVDSIAPGLGSSDPTAYVSLIDDGLFGGDEDDLFGSLELLHGPVYQDDETLWLGMYDSILLEVE